MAATPRSRGDERPPVVVGVDGSPESLAALRWASDYAEHEDLPLHAVIAWQQRTGFGFLPAGPESLHEEARRILERSVHKVLGERGEGVVLVVVEGRPEDALVAASHEASLLVVGERGYSSVAGLLLGHCGEACVRHAACSVVVVRGER